MMSKELEEQGCTCEKGYRCRYCREIDHEQEMSSVHPLTQALYDRGFDVIPEDFHVFGITEHDTVESAELKVLQRTKCLCGEDWDNHENGYQSNYHVLGGCEKSGCARFTMPHNS